MNKNEEASNKDMNTAFRVALEQAMENYNVMKDAVVDEIERELTEREENILKTFYISMISS